MDGAPRDRDAVVERLTLRTYAGKRRKERGMHVDHAVREGIQDRRGHDPHEACEHDAVDAMSLEHLDDGGVERLA